MYRLQRQRDPSNTLPRDTRITFKIRYRYAGGECNYGATVTKTGTQPLMDNLQSITYQTFEQDPVKYHNYEEVRVFVTVLSVPYSP